MDNCIFCRIIARRAPGKIVFEDESLIAFEDANPQAPVHILIVPRQHIASLDETQAADQPLLGRLLGVAAQLAREREAASKGYRTVINNGAWAGQSVSHLHLHLLAGRVFRWPPG